LLELGEREDRIVRNEALFRSVNERVRELVGDLDSGGKPEAVAFVCECGAGSCTASVGLTIPEYEHVRADPMTFFVVSGHEIPEVERIVERRGAYDIVRKHDEEAQIAIETDPRASGARE
jgi:hypothetical protein